MISLKSAPLSASVPLCATVSVLIAVSLLAGCDRGPKKETAPVIRPVLFTIARTAAARATVFAGTVEAQISAGLGFPIFGRLLTRDVNVGDLVVAGQTLGTIDPLALELAVRSSSAALASAQAAFDNAEASEARMKSLRESGSGTQADLDQATAATAAARSAVLRAGAEKTKADEQLKNTRIVAGFDGVVTTVGAEIGQVVPAGQAVVTVAKPDLRDAIVDVPETTAASLSIGAGFEIALQFDPSLKVAGTVREIAPVADSVTRSRRIKIALDNPTAGFRLGTTVTAKVKASAQDTIILPDTAILTRDGKSFVWIVDVAKKAVTLRAVETEARPGGLVSIAKGVAEGDRVVTAGVHSLADGQSVKIGGDE